MMLMGKYFSVRNFNRVSKKLTNKGQHFSKIGVKTPVLNTTTLMHFQIRKDLLDVYSTNKMINIMVYKHFSANLTVTYCFETQTFFVEGFLMRAAFSTLNQNDLVRSRFLQPNF